MFVLGRRSRFQGALLAASMLLPAACSKPPAEPATPADSPPTTPDEASGKEPSPSVSDEAIAPSTTKATSEASPPPPADRELTHRDCRALADKFAVLTRSDEEAKLNPKLSEAQRENARKAFAEAAQILAERWSTSCESNLVGKIASEESLRCAMASKTVAAFDVCLNGPPTSAPAEAKPSSTNTRK